MNHSLSVSQGISKGHKRSGSAAPSMPFNMPKQISHRDLQGIPEEPNADRNAEKFSYTPTVRFTGQGSALAGEASLLTTVLKTPESSMTPQGGSIEQIEHAETLPAHTRRAVQIHAPHNAPPLKLLTNGNQSPVTAEKQASGASQSPNKDTVEVPSTPDRSQHPSVVLSGTVSYCIPAERAISSRAAVYIGITSGIII